MNILLNIDPGLGAEFLSRAADQLFSLALLLIVAYILWKRLNKVEDIQRQYLETDRKEMIEAINKNTEVIERVLNR